MGVLDFCIGGGRVEVGVDGCGEVEGCGLGYGEGSYVDIRFDVCCCVDGDGKFMDGVVGCNVYFLGVDVVQESDVVMGNVVERELKFGIVVQVFDVVFRD